MRVNYAFGFTLSWSFDERDMVYQPYPFKYDTKYGINYSLYLYLKMYESETGNSIPYAMIVDYLSTEYEPNGSLRLCDNGMHPEIQAYVDWAWGRKPDMMHYVDTIDDAYVNYCFDNKNEWPSPPSIVDLSPQMLDELAKKVDDPSYDMDLISLQKQGY